jgi:RHS repeat-associated protein
MVTDANGAVQQQVLYAPFGEVISEYNAYWHQGKRPDYQFNAKEMDEESGMYYYSARYYAPPVFISRDPLFEDYPTLSPYCYTANNPLKYVDPTGMFLTNFEDAEGNIVKHIDDGSNAVFKQTGSGTGKHYTFSGYDETQGGTNQVNLTTAIQEQQNLNMENPDLQQNGATTYCNFATQNVMKTVESALEGNNSVLVTGGANSMIDKLMSGNNLNYFPGTQEDAQEWANAGGLSIVAYRNPIQGRSGHVATYSVGDNISKGQIANIGPAAYTGFLPLNMTISKQKEKQYFLFMPGIVAPNNVIIKP